MGKTASGQQPEKRWWVIEGAGTGKCFACFCVGMVELTAAFTALASSIGVHREKLDLSRYMVDPAPPDLAEWLDAEMHECDDYARMKVPGGWIYREYEAYNAGEQHSSVYVPVAGAAGITVIEESE